MPETLYTPEEAAAQMRVSQRTVYTWLRSGELRGLRAGRAWRIRHEDMQAFMERHAQSASAISRPGSSNNLVTRSDRSRGGSLPPQTDRAARARAARGKFAYLKSTSDEFAARKQEEIEREDRRR
jgi:excisionase family DNA binding protein